MRVNVTVEHMMYIIVAAKKFTVRNGGATPFDISRWVTAANSTVKTPIDTFDISLLHDLAKHARG